MSINSVSPALNYFQQSQKLSSQATELQQNNSHQAADLIVKHAASSQTHNQQHIVENLQQSSKRGSALYMFV